MILLKKFNFHPNINFFGLNDFIIVVLISIKDLIQNLFNSHRISVNATQVFFKTFATF